MFVNLVNTTPTSTKSCTVRHVHWLCAHAQKDRWHEEVVLVTYEMQWTVRYFLHKSHSWYEEAGGPNISPGAQIYALRQWKIWKTLAQIMDKVFNNTTSHYQSPL
jgi:hypothetical protein